MTTFRPLLALGAAVALSACAAGDGVFVQRVDVQPLYSKNLVQWAGAGRDLPLRVTGNPSRIAPQAWADSVAQTMNEIGWLAQTNLTTEPGDSARGNFHVAVIFNAPLALDDGSVCRGDTGGADLLPVDGRSTIALAFCNDDRPVSSGFATTPAILGPGAPQTRAALSQLLRKVFPMRDPDFPDRSDVLLFP